MESEHTPGPWKWRGGVPLDLMRDHDILKSSAKAVVYSEYHDSCGNWVAREVAVCVPSVTDARLIAAAPDLLEELKNLRECCYRLAARLDSEPGNQGVVSMWLFQIRKAGDAIAKAEGGGGGVAEQ